VSVAVDLTDGLIVTLDPRFYLRHRPGGFSVVRTDFTQINATIRSFTVK